MFAAIYARKSTEQAGVADDQKSVARQVEHARAYATRKGWTVDEGSIYVDDGVSGAEFANRPGFLRLMNALKPRAPFQALVMSEESRLGREMVETMGALKLLVQAGVRVFYYLEDKERTLDSPIEKAMMALESFGAEVEREKARQRAFDTSQRKAKAGHVTGGRVFGYDNHRTAAGHVERTVKPVEKSVVQRIFQLSIEGCGVKAIAKALNAEGAVSPRAQQGRSRSWAPSSVRAILYRPLYRGELVWNRSRKRDTWGRKHQTARAQTDWIRRQAAELQIVSDDVWTAAHRQIDAARDVYMTATRGQCFGRPALGNPSKYLMTNLALCGACQNSLRVRSREHGSTRKYFYGCSGYHERGRTVCTNKADVPMTDADEILIEALLDDVLDETILKDSVDEAVRLLRGDDVAGRLERLEAEIVKMTRERDRLVAAVAAGGALAGLLDALRDREAHLVRLTADRDAVRAQRGLSASEAGRVRGELMALAESWRHVLADDPTHARPIVSSLLIGRVTISSESKGKWTMTGNGTLRGLFETDVFPSVVRPQADS